jgi:hypothetical protein
VPRFDLSLSISPASHQRCVVLLLSVRICQFISEDVIGFGLRHLIKSQGKHVEQGNATRSVMSKLESSQRKCDSHHVSRGALYCTG